MCHLTLHHFLPPKFHFSYSLLIPWTLFLFFPQFLFCCGRNLGIALILYHCKLMLLFFPKCCISSKNTFLKSYSLWSTFYQTGFDFSSSPIFPWSGQLFYGKFYKIVKKLQCPFLLTVVFNHFDSNLSVWLLSPDLFPLNLLFLIYFPSHFWNFCFIQPQKWGPLEKQLFLHLLLPVLTPSARMYHIKYYILSKWYLDVILVLYL